MNDAALHLLFNHLPSIGQITGLCVLLSGLFLQKNTTKLTGAWIIFIAAIFVIPANMTGENAEEMVEHIDGVSRKLIHEHEEAAGYAFVLTLISGFFAMSFIAVSKYKKQLAKWMLALLFISCAFSISAIIKTSHDGGLIRHPEIHNDFKPEHNESHE